MPLTKKPKRDTTGNSEYDNLEKWMRENHKGYSSKLISRDIPGAGRGLFAAEAIPAGETILEIPSSSLLNPLRLASTASIPDDLRPRPSGSSSQSHTQKKARTTRSSDTSTITGTNRLNTTQYLTLYLALHRDPSSRRSAPWEAYLETLPKTFEPWHPLTWYYQSEDSWYRRLIEWMPISARMKLEDMKRRYEEDAAVLKGVLTNHEPFESKTFSPGIVTDYTLLWAWLNVNTRTVSVPLDLPGPSSLNNHTLVPILDMLNHSSKPDEIIPKPIQFPSSTTAPSVPGPSRRGAQPHLIPGKIGFRLIAPERALEKDEQVRFEYGAHSSEMLFTEYGFTPEQMGGDWLDQPNGEVDVNDLVEKMFPIDSEKIQSTLEEMGCWKQNMIYAFPKPVSASHGLITTLRSYNLNKIKVEGTAEILPVSGLKTHVEADGIERNLRGDLIDLCQRVCDESDDRSSEIQKANDARLAQLAGLGDETNQGQRDTSSELEAATNSVRALWEERKVIAKEFLMGIKAGQRIWD